VIRELNGQKIANGSALQVAVSEERPGTTIQLGILRDGSPQTISLKLGEFNAKNQMAGNENGGNGKGKIGIGLDDLTPGLRQRLGIPADVHGGAAVGTVRPGSPADDAGIVPGDVILEVNQLPRRPRQQQQRLIAHPTRTQLPQLCSDPRSQLGPLSFPCAV